MNTLKLSDGSVVTYGRLVKMVAPKLETQMTAKEAGDRIDHLVKRLMADKPSLTYTEAYAVVKTDNPRLVRAFGRVTR